jgi:DNA-binding PucR family transcriptional regulator
LVTSSRRLDADIAEQLTEVLASLPPDELGEQMADQLAASIPDFDRATDEDFRAGLVLSCVGNLNELWERLRRATPEDPIVPPADATAWSRELVHRGMPLPGLLRAYRLGHAFAVGRIERAAEDLQVPLDVRWRLLTHVSQESFAYVDTICTQLVEDYDQEHARWIRGAAAARAELVATILARDPVDPSVAAERLRYDVSRRHLAFVVWADPDAGARPAGALESAAGELAAQLGGGPVLIVPIGERVVWAWTSGAGLEDDTADMALDPSFGLRAAVGMVAPGLVGMADSHEQAQTARRVGELLAIRLGSVIDYRKAGLMGLLSALPDQAMTFVVAELGELAMESDATARLRATLRVYCEENLSPARAARRLGIHHNTVVYRVKQVEEILGRAIEDRRLELEVALRLAERLDGLRAACDRERGAVSRS